MTEHIIAQDEVVLPMQIERGIKYEARIDPNFSEEHQLFVVLNQTSGLSSGIVHYLDIETGKTIEEYSGGDKVIVELIEKKLRSDWDDLEYFSFRIIDDIPEENEDWGPDWGQEKANERSE